MNILEKVMYDITVASDEKIRIASQHFFKNGIQCHGVKSTDVRETAKKFYREIKNFKKEEIFDLCEELWRTNYQEESCIACEWAYRIARQYEKSDFKILDHWVKNYVNNWAKCDILCNHTVGTFIEMYPECIGELEKWATSDNRWVRRASCVTLIIPAKHGLFLDEIFKLAKMVLTDEDDMVQKGYGWMLKAASEAHLQEVYDFVVSNKASMPRTAYRYAIEKMPADMKKEAMKK
ncbi:hypothetical protein FACS1894152_6940 [Bacilli bacterium]|nr:hypothetical protein FACS1894152_6940 [Bacilli bacterium]